MQLELGFELCKVHFLGVSLLVRSSARSIFRVKVRAHLFLLGFGDESRFHAFDALIYHLREHRHDPLGLMTCHPILLQALNEEMRVEVASPGRDGDVDRTGETGSREGWT
jgi:hypothetical protein